MGSSHEKRPHEQAPSPFDSAAGAAAQKVGPATGSGEAQGTVPGPNMGPTAGAGPGSAAPFMGLYDPPAGAGPAGSPGPATAGDSSPHVTLFTGITENKDKAEGHAATLDQNAGYYAGYDTTKPGAAQPSWAQDALMDAGMVLYYSKAGNQVDLTPARDSNGKIQYDANGNVKYDIDYGYLAGSDLVNMVTGQDYETAKELGQSGANAVLNSDQGHPPAKTEPLVIDAHSGGGQTAFFTALELYQKGYTDINIVGFDMAMTPEQRATLEQLGVDVSNATSHVDANVGPLTNQGGITGVPQDISITSPMASLIQWAMGGGTGPGYYDSNIKINPGDINSQEGIIGGVTDWHDFQGNSPSLEYMKQQNINQSNSKPHKTGPDLFSSDINLKEKSASIDVGGPKGLGAYVNLSEGQLDLNVFGKHVDIDQSFRNAGKTVTRAIDKAKDLGQDASDWVQDKWQAADTWVQDKAQTASNWAQDKAQTANNWVQDKAQAAGDWLQGTTSAVSNWLFGSKQSAGSPATQSKSQGVLAGAQAGAGSSPGPVAGKSGGAAKPSASKSAAGGGTVVTAPKDSPGVAPAATPRSPSQTTSAGKAADDIARPSAGASAGKSQTQIKPGGDAAPKSDANKSASPSKPGSSTQPKAPTNTDKSPSPGKAADDVAPKSSSHSKPTKSSSKALDDIAPKNSSGGSRGKEDRFHRA